MFLGEVPPRYERTKGNENAAVRFGGRKGFQGKQQKYYLGIDILLISWYTK